MRSVADVDRLRGEIAPGRRVVIIGGGYIGLEVAATCRDAGLDVVAQSGDAVVLSPACSSFDMFRDYAHRAEVFRAAVARVTAGGRAS